MMISADFEDCFVDFSVRHSAPIYLPNQTLNTCTGRQCYYDCMPQSTYFRSKENVFYLTPDLYSMSPGRNYLSVMVSW